MSISIPDRVVVFDYGEVISVSPTAADQDAVLALAGVDAERFWPPYWAHRGDLDQGVTLPHEYWEILRGELGAEWDAPTVQSLWAADFRGWISVEPGTVRLLDELHTGGTRMALLSNAGFDFAGPFRYGPTGRYWERVFVSAEMGLIKPDPEIYAVTARELGIDPTAMVFIDNKIENVEGAESIGITGHHFTGVAGLRDFLESLAASDPS